MDGTKKEMLSRNAGMNTGSLRARKQFGNSHLQVQFYPPNGGPGRSGLEHGRTTGARATSSFLGKTSGAENIYVETV